MGKFTTHFYDSLYKCKKEVPRAHGIKYVCKWNGALGDYIAHIRKVHPNSYYCSPKGRFTFTWRTPYVGDQMDTCILKIGCHTHLLYEIYYSETNGAIVHTFWRIDDHTTPLQVIISNTKGEHSKCAVNTLTHELLDKRQYIRTCVNREREVLWIVQLCRQ